MRKSKLYLETSVWDFCFAADAPEKPAATLQFLERVKQGAYDIFVSEVVFREIANASDTQKPLLLQLLTECRHEKLEMNEAVLQLASQYLTHGVLPATAKADAVNV